MLQHDHCQIAAQALDEINCTLCQNCLKIDACLRTYSLLASCICCCGVHVKTCMTVLLRQCLHALLLACCHADMIKRGGQGGEAGGGGGGGGHFSAIIMGRLRWQPGAVTTGHNPKGKGKILNHADTSLLTATVGMTCLSGHAQLLLDSAAVTVKVPVGASNHTLACGLVVLHHTLQTDIADVSASPVTGVLLPMTQLGWHKRT